MNIEDLKDIQDSIITETDMAKKLKEWMKTSSDPIVQELTHLVGGMQLLKEKYGEITLVEAITKTSEIILSRLIKDNTEKSNIEKTDNTK